MRRTLQLIVSLLIAAAVLLLGLRTGAAHELWSLSRLHHRRDHGRVQMKIEAVVGSEDQHLHAILLAPTAGGDRVLPLFIEGEEARSLAGRLKHPSSNGGEPDLLASAIHSLGGSVREVVIESVEPMSTKATLHLQQGRRDIVVKAPAPTSLSLAVAEGAPIYVGEGLLEDAGLTRDQVRALRQHAPDPLPPGHPPLGPGATPPPDHGSPAPHWRPHSNDDAGKPVEM